MIVRKRWMLADSGGSKSQRFRSLRDRSDWMPYRERSPREAVDSNDNPEWALKRISKYTKTGFNHLYFSGSSSDEQKFIGFCGEEIISRLRESLNRWQTLERRAFSHLMILSWPNYHEYQNEVERRSYSLLIHYDEIVSTSSVLNDDWCKVMYLQYCEDLYR